MSGGVVNIYSFSFARGAIVQRKGGGPNMLVVRGLGDRTVVVVCETDDDGSLGLRDEKSVDLVQLLPSATPELPGDLL